MRIWLLSSELPQEFSGGIARYVDSFAPLLGAAGHEITIVARSHQPLERFPAPGVRVLGITPPERNARVAAEDEQPDANPAYPYNVLSYWPALSYQFAEEVLALAEREGPPDLIESQEYGALPYYLLQRKLTQPTPLEHTPVLLHMHSATFNLLRLNHEPSYRLPEYWVGQMEKFCLLAADALLSPSQFLAESVRQTLGRPLEIATIPYPLAAASLLPRSQECAAEAGELIYVGRLELRKGVLPLLAACERLWAAGKAFRLTLVGGDTEYAPRNTTVGSYIQRRYARWIEGGQLRLLGRVPHDEVLRLLERAWAAVIPSVWENFPNTCMEALAAGRVVLTSLSGGQAEMVGADGEGGLLFDWEKPGSCEYALERVLALSDAERAALAARGRARILELCSPQTVLERRLEHYAQVQQRVTPRVIFPSVAVPGGDVARWPADAVEQPGLLSVVVPFYNLGVLLEQTLISVLASDYQPLEVIVVNDGSTDALSLEVLAALEQRGLRNLRVLHTPNRGLASARNVGVDAARGEFVTFVDADDLVEPAYFTRALYVLQRYANVAFVYSWERFFEGTSGIWPTFNAELPYMLGHNMLAAFAVLRRRAFLAAARNKPEIEYSLEDFESWLSLVEAGGVGVSLPDPLVRYRVRADSMLRGSNANQQLYLYELIAERHPNLYRQWGGELFHLQNANGPGFRWNHPAMEHYPSQHERVRELEREREKLWAEHQRLSQRWQEQYDYIEEQRNYSQQLEHERERVWAEHQRLSQRWQEQYDYIQQQQRALDTLWADHTRLSESWQEQKAYIEQLEPRSGLRRRLASLGRRVRLFRRPPK